MRMWRHFFHWYHPYRLFVLLGLGILTVGFTLTGGTYGAPVFVLIVVVLIAALAKDPKTTTLDADNRKALEQCSWCRVALSKATASRTPTKCELCGREWDEWDEAAYQ